VWLYVVVTELILFACSDLSNNQISTIAADAFDGLRSLTSLYVTAST